MEEEAEAVVVVAEAEAVDGLAASTSLLLTRLWNEISLEYWTKTAHT